MVAPAVILRDLLVLQKDLEAVEKKGGLDEDTSTRLRVMIKLVKLLRRRVLLT